METIQTVAPLSEPISLEEAKDFLRVLDADSDLIIESLITVCREHIEKVTNRQLESATFELFADSFICRLPKDPVSSIVKIEYMDETGSYVLLDPLEYYLYKNNGVSYIHYANRPIIFEHEQSVKITFISGYTVVPESLKQYMKVKVSTLFENREEFVIGVSIAEFGGKFIESLLIPYTIRSI